MKTVYNLWARSVNANVSQLDNWVYCEKNGFVAGNQQRNVGGVVCVCVPNI